MGGGLNGDTPPESEQKTYTDFFNEHFPFYLSIGMSPENYWNGDCELVKYYRQSFEITRKRESQRIWLQGMYVYDAICKSAPLVNAFMKKHEPLPYPDEPYPTTAKEVEERKVRKMKERYEALKSMVSGWAKKTNERMTANEGEVENDG